MSTTHDLIGNTLNSQTKIDDTLRGIFTKHFEIESEKNKENPGYKAYALNAVEVAIALSNLVLSINKPDSHRGFRAVSDLIYGLNANDFWVKNAPVLVPALTVILNSHRDYIDMQVRRNEMQEYAVYDKLITGAQCVVLEVFSMLLYLVGGPLLMNVASLPLKLDLAPYFL